MSCKVESSVGSLSKHDLQQKRKAPSPLKLVSSKNVISEELEDTKVICIISISSSSEFF